MFSVRKALTGCSFVHGDEIWYEAGDITAFFQVIYNYTLTGRITFAESSKLQEGGQRDGESWPQVTRSVIV